MADRGPFTLDCPAPISADETVRLTHGDGGLMTHRLIETIFRPAFAHSPEDLSHDGAVFDVPSKPLAFTTDSYVIKPLFFPGGDIGTLAVNGTVNDLAMCGARPLFLSVGVILEEGFPLADLRRIAGSMADAARAAKVRLVAGDTKVVERGKGDGLYLNTSGVGTVITQKPVAPFRVEPGDAVVVSGDIGRHGIAILAHREGLDFEPVIESDCAALTGPVLALVEAGVDLHCLRDLTRGGLATALIEIAAAADVEIELGAEGIPVADTVRGACEILGLDPLYMANEGRFVAFVRAKDAEDTLRVLSRFDAGAGIVGKVGEKGTAGGLVTLQTLGGRRMLDMLSGEQAPRIC